MSLCSTPPLQHHLCTCPGPGRACGLCAVSLINRTKAALQVLVPYSSCARALGSPVPPFKNALLRYCPSVRPVGVWQHSWKLSGDGGQTAWMDVKYLRKETELSSCPGHALFFVFLPLLLVFLVMFVWFVRLSSLELASQLVLCSVIIIFHLCTHHSCICNNEKAMEEILRVFSNIFSLRKFPF